MTSNSCVCSVYSLSIKFFVQNRLIWWKSNIRKITYSSDQNKFFLDSSWWTIKRLAILCVYNLISSCPCIPQGSSSEAAFNFQSKNKTHMYFNTNATRKLLVFEVPMCLCLNLNFPSMRLNWWDIKTPYTWNMLSISPSLKSTQNWYIFIHPLFAVRSYFRYVIFSYPLCCAFDVH